MGHPKPSSVAKASKTAPKKVASKAVVSRTSKPTAPVKKAVAVKKVATVKPVAKPVKAPARKAPPILPKKSSKSVESPAVVSTPVSPSTLAERLSSLSVPLASFEPTIDEGANPGHILNDEVLDETEQAQMLQLQEQAHISFRARELNKPETHPDFDGLHCVECDDEIPEKRLALRRVRCVNCQEFLEEERKKKQRTMA